MKKFIVFMIIAITALIFESCAGTCQRMKANGSIVGTTTGDWIVIKQSGGKITDVYKLENTFVQSEAGSDGWLFIDQYQNPVHIGGDMKAIRVTNNKAFVFDSYVEYHTEHDSLSYLERWKAWNKLNNYSGKK